MSKTSLHSGSTHRDLCKRLEFSHKSLGEFTSLKLEKILFISLFKCYRCHLAKSEVKTIQPQVQHHRKPGSDTLSI